MGLSELIERNGGRAPKIKCVICGTINSAYLRKNGVYVVPFNGLKD